MLSGTTWKSYTLCWSFFWRTYGRSEVGGKMTLPFTCTCKVGDFWLCKMQWNQAEKDHLTRSVLTLQNIFSVSKIWSAGMKLLQNHKPLPKSPKNQRVKNNLKIFLWVLIRKKSSEGLLCLISHPGDFRHIFNKSSGTEGLTKIATNTIQLIIGHDKRKG